MAFIIQVKKRNGEVIWTRQWATAPSDDQVEENTIADGIAKGGLFRYAHEVCRAIKQMIADPTIQKVTTPDNVEVCRA